MNSVKRPGFRASQGISGIWIILIIAVLAGGIFILSKFGPIYSRKWELEDYMEQRMLQFYSLGVDGIYEQLDKFITENQMPIQAYEDCTVEGEQGEPGIIVCNYKEKITFPFYVYIYPVRAEYKLTKIPIH